VGDYTYWPQAALRKPRVGGLFNPNVERIAALRPDLAVLMPSERDLATKLAPLGIASLIVPIESLDDVEKSFALVAARCGVPEAGARLRREWRAGLASPPPGGAPLKVVLSVGRDAGRLSDVTVAGKGTFLDEILVRSGGTNAFADAPTHYPQIGLEEIVARNPDLILEFRSEPISPEKREALIREWDQLSGLDAVKKGRVAVIAADYTLIPGPRLPLLARDLRQALARARKGAP
jgi:iron complex transport system substrate-binding protein